MSSLLALPNTPPWRFVFVLEESLGHLTHGRNLVRSLGHYHDIDPTIVRIGSANSEGFSRLPLLGSWSSQASWRARRALLRRVKQGRVDAIYIHTQVAALFIGSLMRAVPTVVSLDATPVNFDSVGAGYDHRPGSGPVSWAKHYVTRRAFDGAAGLVSFSRWAADSLLGDYGIAGEKVSVIRFGVDLPLMKSTEERTRRHKPRILFVGGDFARKGGHDLLAALKPLSDRAELDIVSNAPLPPIPGRLTCRIHRGLASDSPELARLFREADLFALPSRADCSPYAIAEALANGLPIVSCSVGAITEMVVDGVNGYLVPPGSPERLSMALRRLLDQPLLRESMGFKSRRLAEREYDMKQNHAAILRLMVRLAAGQQTKGPVTSSVPAAP